MRTIKFRGFNAKNSKWLYGSHIINRGKHFVAPDEFADDKTWEDYEVEPETIGQFTGLTDKNGKEIYEGDIIRSTRNGFGGVVKWHKRGYFYICEDIFEDDPDYNGDYANLGSMLEHHPYFEVVGNISDNVPERLKGGEQ